MRPIASILSRLETANLPQPLRHPLRDARILVHDFVRCNLLQSASAMSYSTLVSIVPSLVAVFSVLSVFSPLVGRGTSLIDGAKNFLIENLASSSAQAVVQYLEAMLHKVSLKSIGWGSFLGMLVTLTLLLRQIEGALNQIWFVHKGRNLFTRLLYFWSFITMGAMGLGLVIGLTSGFDLHKVLGIAADQNPADELGPHATWLIGFGAAFLFFFFLYKVVPNCFVAARNAALGALVSALLLNQGARFYGIYVKDITNYQSLYGALAQLPVFLLWLYICWMVILLGALISWRAQEGFPRADEEEEAFADVEQPLQQLRNVHIKVAMPVLALVVFYKSHQEGHGRGLTCQQLAHSLKLPVAWVLDAARALAELGYVIATRNGNTEGGTVTDAYFPTMPPETLTLERLRKDLARPMDAWLAHWHYELPMDLRAALRVVADDRAGEASRTLAQALAAIGPAETRQ